MNERELRDLESAEQWDYENAERKPPVRSGRVVVSVAFPRRDFELVTEHAANVGMKTSEFIRNAALEKATTSVWVTGFIWAGSTSGTFASLAGLGPTTRGILEATTDIGERVVTAA